MAVSTDLRDSALKHSRSIFKRQRDWRRHLHRHPEVSWQEHQTTAFLKKQLTDLGAEILPLDMPTGVLAELNGNSPGRRVAVRSDIDALPVTERTDLPYASCNEGVMHACGHDMHMASVLGAAAVLSKMKDRWRGSVRLLFQPAEEQPPGGARPMIENGALEGVDMIFGLHVDPDIPIGKISLRDGPVMATVYDFDLAILGKGGHAARPHQAVDAISVSAGVIASIQQMVARRINPMTPVAVSFGTINGGSVRNVVADRVELQGTARTLSTKLAKNLPRLLKQTVAGTCRAHGADFELTEIAGYPILVNDSRVNRILNENYSALFGKDKILTTELLLGGEDFACYLEHVPGAMFRLGIRNRRLKADKPWHAPDFMVDESALTYGTALLVTAALDVLNAQAE